MWVKKLRATRLSISRSFRPKAIPPVSEHAERPTATEAATVTQAAAPKHRRLAGLWNIAKAVGPIVVSVTALIISALSYNDQHRADVAALIASRQAYATQVSFWLVATNNPRVDYLVIQNRSNAPVMEVYAKTTPGSTLNPNVHSRILDAIEEDLQFVYLGIIPPCSVVTTSALQLEVRRAIQIISQQQHISHKLTDTLMRPGVIQANMFGLQFTDADGATWFRTFDGKLTKPAELAPGTNGPAVRPIAPEGSKIRPADGCS